MSLIHVIKATVSPSAAPERAGMHWINTATKETWLSIGTDSVADWQQVLPGGGGGGGGVLHRSKVAQSAAIPYTLFYGNANFYNYLQDTIVNESTPMYDNATLFGWTVPTLTGTKNARVTINAFNNTATFATVWKQAVGDPSPSIHKRGSRSDSSNAINNTIDFEVNSGDKVFVVWEAGFVPGGNVADTKWNWIDFEIFDV